MKKQHIKRFNESDETSDEKNLTTQSNLRTPDFFPDVDLEKTNISNQCKDRVKNNEYNCQIGAGYILYTLSELGLLKHPYNIWSHGTKPTEGEDLVKYNRALIELAEMIIIFQDDISEDGRIA